MSQFRTLDSAEVKGKRVLVRVDLNVPMENGRVTDATRIERRAADHPRARGQGRARSSCSPISAGRRAGRTRRMSLTPVAGCGRRTCSAAPSASPSIASATSPTQAIAAMKDGDVSCWRTPASTRARRRTIPAFVEALRQARRRLRQRRLLGRASRPRLDRGRRAQAAGLRRPRDAGGARRAGRWRSGNPARPVAAIVGGAKVSTKLDLLEQSRDAGRHARSSAAAWPTPSCSRRARLSASRCARRISPTPRAPSCRGGEGGRLPPSCCRSTRSSRRSSRPHAHARVVDVDHIGADEMMLDIGPKSVGRRRGGARVDQDAGVERPVRRLRDAAFRGGDLRASPRPPPL